MHKILKYKVANSLTNFNKEEEEQWKRSDRHNLQDFTYYFYSMTGTHLHEVPTPSGLKATKCYQYQNLHGITGYIAVLVA